MEHFDEHPFVLTLFAPRNSGKSFLIGKILHHIIDNYDKIHILCPSLKFNEDYDAFINEEDVYFIVDPDQDALAKIIDEASWRQEEYIHKQRVEKYGSGPVVRKFNPLPEFKKALEEDEIEQKRMLIILDDCIDSGVLNFRGIADSIAERGRHFKIDMIITAQRISAVSSSIRLNSDVLVIFRPYSIRETEKFLEDFVSKNNLRVFRQVLGDIFSSGEYIFIYLDNFEKDPRCRIKISDAQHFVKRQYEILDLKSIEEAAQNKKDSQKCKLNEANGSKKKFNEVAVEEEEDVVPPHDADE